MNLRSKFNFAAFQTIVNRGMENFKSIENKEHYLIIGNPDFKTVRLRKPGLNRVAYLKGEQVSGNAQLDLLYPEIHQTKEGLFLCTCHDFFYSGIKEKQICQAISLEIVCKLAAKIHGIIVVIDYNDFYSSRGLNYREIITKLAQLCHSDFNQLFKSLVFIIINKPTSYEGNIKDDIMQTRKACLEERQNEFSSIDEEEVAKSEHYKQEKDILIFEQLFVSHEKNIFILDELDEGKSRSEIISALSQLKPIESLNFETCYEEVMEGINFDLRKFVGDTINTIKSTIQESNKCVINI